MFKCKKISLEIDVHISKDTPTIKDVVLKWGCIEIAKFILKLLPVSINGDMQLERCRSFYRGL